MLSKLKNFINTRKRDFRKQLLWLFYFGNSNGEWKIRKNAILWNSIADPPSFAKQTFPSIFSKLDNHVTNTDNFPSRLSHSLPFSPFDSNYSFSLIDQRVEREILARWHARTYHGVTKSGLLISLANQQKFTFTESSTFQLCTKGETVRGSDFPPDDPGEKNTRSFSRLN